MHQGEALLNEISGQSQLLIAAVSASMSGIVITDCRQKDYPIIFCNDAFVKMTGYTREETIGRNCRFLQAADREQVSRFKIQEALAANRECNVELANYRKDGSIFYNELYLAPIRDRTGETSHYIGIQNDITVGRLKEASIKLEQQNAQKLQEHKKDVMNAIAHDLKTPLTSLKLTLQMMDRIISEEPGSSRQLLQLSSNAESFTNSLAYLIDEISKMT